MQDHGYHGLVVEKAITVDKTKICLKFLLSAKCDWHSVKLSKIPMNGLSLASASFILAFAVWPRGCHCIPFQRRHLRPSPCQPQYCGQRQQEAAVVITNNQARQARIPSCLLFLQLQVSSGLGRQPAAVVRGFRQQDKPRLLCNTRWRWVF